MKRTLTLALVLLALALPCSARAELETYALDPQHTHPSFEVDHGGLSVFRGLFKTSSGSVQLDTAAQTGTVDVQIDAASLEMGVDALNKHVVGPEMLDSGTYPIAVYHGKLDGFKGGIPTHVTGELTLHGVTRPVSLEIDAFKCLLHPLLKKWVCGADATGTFNRADFGVNFGAQYGFNMDVLLRIQVEAIRL